MSSQILQIQKDYIKPICFFRVGLKRSSNLGSNKFSTLTKDERKKILETLWKKVEVKTTGNILKT